jgi:hypothetical protein
MKIQRTADKIQACGTFDPTLDEYSFTLACGALAVTFEFLSKEDIEHINSCLSCMLINDKTD